MASGGDMRCIGYVSRAPIADRALRLPRGLSEIIRVSRESNLVAQVTGIIFYRKGQYFQVLEGPYDAVGTLMTKIAADPRHEDLWIFMDTPISERCFESWGVSVFDFVDQGPYFNTFIENNRHKIDSFTTQQKERLKVFVDAAETSGAPEESYKGKNLRLLAWPDLNNISEPQLVIALCVKLTKKPYSFDKLVEENDFGTSQQLTETLKSFETLGILTISEPELIQEPVIPEKKPNKFYGAIKKFLGMG